MPWNVMPLLTPQKRHDAKPYSPLTSGTILEQIGEDILLASEIHDCRMTVGIKQKTILHGSLSQHEVKSKKGCFCPKQLSEAVLAQIAPPMSFFGL